MEKLKIWISKPNPKKSDGLEYFYNKYNHDNITNCLDIFL